MEVDVKEYYDRKILYQGTNTQVCTCKRRGSEASYVMKLVVKNNSLMVSCLKREYQILSKLRYPGIPMVYDWVEGKEHVGMVMEEIEGISLELILGQGEIESEMARTIVYQLWDIMCYLQSRKPAVCHLDLKPSNLMISAKGQVSILDFGIARYLGEALQEGCCFGTKNYAAPEQLAGREVGLYTDIYSFGKIIERLGKEEFSELGKACTHVYHGDRISSFFELETILKKVY